MLFFDSSEETAINPQGNNNINSVTVAEPVTIEHPFIEYLLIAITAIKVIELAYILYRSNQRRLKKRYTGPAA